MRSFFLDPNGGDILVQNEKITLHGITGFEISRIKDSEPTYLGTAKITLTKIDGIKSYKIDIEHDKHLLTFLFLIIFCFKLQT